MNIQITSRKFKAKDSLKEFINDELNTLEKLKYDIKGVEVILSYENVNNNTKIAEVIVNIPGRVVTAKESSEEFEKSVALAVQKVEKQITKFKTKKMDIKRTELVLEETEEESQD